MEIINKKSLKLSKRKDNILSRKVKSLVKQGKLEEELEMFPKIDFCVEVNENIVKVDIDTYEAKNVDQKLNSSSMEIDKTEKNEVFTKSANCAIILNLPLDASKEELSNFLSRRGIPVDAISIDNAKYSVIETTDVEAISKISKLILEKPLASLEGLKVSSLTGNTQRLAVFCKRNTILNKSIIIVKNINAHTQIADILSIIPNNTDIKKHTVSKAHYKKVKTQMIVIEFSSQNQTDDALKHLNGAIVDDHKLIAEFKHKLVEDAVLESRSLTLLLKDLPENTDYQTIKNLELPCMHIQLVKKSAKQLCFLKFKNSKDISEAYEVLSNKEINGSKISVKFVDTNPDKPEKEVDKTKLHITNLPYICKKDEVEKEFDMADSIKFPMTSSGKSKGCCYLSFKSEELAALGMEAFKDKLFNGRKIRCTFAKKSNSSEISIDKLNKEKPKLTGNVVTLFNLPKTVKVEEIKSKFKHVKLVNIVKKGNVALGIAEVHFTEQKFAKEAIDSIEKIIIGGRVIKKELKGGKWRNGTARTKNIKTQKPTKKEKTIEMDE